MPEDFIAVIAILMVFGIPMVALLTHHQRKMAELIHSKNRDVNPAVVDEIHRLRAEVSQLRTELHETAIALDDVRKNKSGDLGRIDQRIGNE